MRLRVGGDLDRLLVAELHLQLVRLGIVLRLLLEPALRQQLRQRDPVTVLEQQLLLIHVAGEGPGAEEPVAESVTLLVRPDRHGHPSLPILPQDPLHRGQTRGDTQGAVQPAAVRHRVQVRAHDHVRPLALAVHDERVPGIIPDAPHQFASAEYLTRRLVRLLLQIREAQTRDAVLAGADLLELLE